VRTRGEVLDSRIRSSIDAGAELRSAITRARSLAAGS